MVVVPSTTFFFYNSFFAIVANRVREQCTGLNMEVTKRKLRRLFHFSVMTKRQKRNIRLCFGTIFIVLAFYGRFYYQDEQDGSVEVASIGASQLNTAKMILMYTPWPYDRQPWVLVHCGGTSNLAFDIEGAKRNRPPGTSQTKFTTNILPFSNGSPSFPMGALAISAKSH